MGTVQAIKPFVLPTLFDGEAKWNKLSGQGAIIVEDRTNTTPTTSVTNDASPLGIPPYRLQMFKPTNDGVRLAIDTHGNVVSQAKGDQSSETAKGPSALDMESIVRDLTQHQLDMEKLLSSLTPEQISKELIPGLIEAAKDHRKAGKLLATEEKLRPHFSSDHIPAIIESALKARKWETEPLYELLEKLATKDYYADADDDVEVDDISYLFLPEHVPGLIKIFNQGSTNDDLERMIHNLAESKPHSFWGGHIDDLEFVQRLTESEAIDCLLQDIDEEGSNLRKRLDHLDALLMNEKSPKVRAAIVRAMGKFAESKDEINLLEIKLKDKDPDVRQAAQEALDKIKAR
jgi:hypothetical protein